MAVISVTKTDEICGVSGSTDWKVMTIFEKGGENFLVGGNYGIKKEKVKTLRKVLETLICTPQSLLQSLMATSRNYFPQNLFSRDLQSGTNCFQVKRFTGSTVD